MNDMVLLFVSLGQSCQPVRIFRISYGNQTKIRRYGSVFKNTHFGKSRKWYIVTCNIDRLIIARRLLERAILLDVHVNLSCNAQLTKGTIFTMSQFNGAPEKAKRLRLLKSAREHIMCSMSVLYLHVYMYRYMYSPCAYARVGTV